MTYLYRYPLLYSGILIKRYKRFFADIQLDSGEVVTAHCSNTGPMTGICQPGSLVQLSYSDNPKRTLRYTWEMIQVNDNQLTWVGVNTALPNRVTKLALEKFLFPELGSYNQIRFEVAYGVDKKSRVDFLLTGERTTYIEVIGTPPVIGGACNDQGQKHYMGARKNSFISRYKDNAGTKTFTRINSIATPKRCCNAVFYQSR